MEFYQILLYFWLLRRILELIQEGKEQNRLGDLLGARMAKVYSNSWKQIVSFEKTHKDCLLFTINHKSQPCLKMSELSFYFNWLQEARDNNSSFGYKPQNCHFRAAFEVQQSYYCLENDSTQQCVCSDCYLPYFGSLMFLAYQEITIKILLANRFGK